MCQIAGWRDSRTVHAGIVLNVLEHAVHQRRPQNGGGMAQNLEGATISGDPLLREPRRSGHIDFGWPRRRQLRLRVGSDDQRPPQGTQIQRHGPCRSFETSGTRRSNRLVLSATTVFPSQSKAIRRPSRKLINLQRWVLCPRPPTKANRDQGFPVWFRPIYRCYLSSGIAVTSLFTCAQAMRLKTKVPPTILPSKVGTKNSMATVGKDASPPMTT